MDDFRREDSQDNNPIPPSVRSEKIGPNGSVESKMNKKGLRRFFTWKWVSLVVFTSFLLLVGSFSAIILSAKTYKLDEINNIDFSTTIYGKDRKSVVGRIGSENREYLTYDQIRKHNPDLPLAFVKVEDERYFNHHGVDYRGFVRALKTNILSGSKEQGASTITMQVARNVVLKDKKKKFTRKFKEMVAAYNLEREASKEKILEVYMNYIYFGNGVHGVKTAAEIYFGKDITKEALEPYEMALLAGLPQAPSAYNPYGTEVQKKSALQRRNVALMLMAKENSTPPLISQNQKRSYQKKELGVDEEFKTKYLTHDKYIAYKDFIQKEIKERYGISYSELNSGGYKIYTSMDIQAQSSVDKAMKDDRAFLNKKGINAGVTLMDPNTGEVIAIGGGRSFTPGSYNWAVEKKQPGSAIKPLTVFAPLVEFRDYNEYTQVVDRPFNYNGWKPQNYVKGKFYGRIPLKEVVKMSLNASTSELLVKEVTVPKSYQFVTEELELPLVPSDEVPAALALGGLTRGVSTVDMAQAYTAFANEGNMTKAHAVLEVIDSEGEVEIPLEGKGINKDENTKRVWAKKTAWYMTRMLQGVVENGTGRGAKLQGGRPVVGKSGTTQNSGEGWFVGYTPNLVGAVTVFNEPGSKELSVSRLSSRLFSRVMSEALKGKRVHQFKRPSGIEEPKPPFKLEEPKVKGNFDKKSQSIHLSWVKQDDRVSFEVLRSENGKHFVSLGEQASGSTGYTDTNIGLNEFPMPGSAKITYYYQVVAIDTLTGERETSGMVEVVVKQETPIPRPGDDGGVHPGPELPGEPPASG